MTQVTGRVISNIVSIFGDMSKMISDLHVGQWEQAGLDFGDILVISLGEIPAATNMYLY